MFIWSIHSISSKMWLYSLIEKYDGNIEFFNSQTMFFIEIKKTLKQIVNTEEEEEEEKNMKK